MPLTDDIRMISIDDHIHEPKDTWTSRVPDRFKERCPRLIELSEDLTAAQSGSGISLAKGSEVWVFEGQLAVATGMVTLTAENESGLVETRSKEPVRYERMRPGAWDPVARLADMDEDGVWMQTPFPSFPGFGGNKFLFADDKELSLACVRAYNDMILDEWCAAAPDRYIGLIILPLWDAADCVDEIKRCVPKGAKGISFPDNPAAMGLPSFHSGGWDPVFSACEEANLPLLMHFGSSRVVPWTSPDAPLAVTTSLFGITLFNSMAELVFSPVFESHPTLKVAYAEGGIGWVPYAKMRLDQVWSHYRNYKLERPINANRRPSDVVREHIWGCFIDDPVGLLSLSDIGEDRVLWESDYPHADSLWPNSRTNAIKVLADVPTDVARRIVHDNAVDLFSLSVSSLS